MKNWKTTALGILSILAGAVSIYLVYMDKASLTEAGAYLALVLAFVEGLKGFLTKDHDKDNNSEMLKGPGGGGVRNPKPEE